MVGSSVYNFLKIKNYKNIFVISKKNLNLTDQIKTQKYIKKIRPDFVIIAAAKVGGIFANSTQPADFLYDNLVIETNIIKAAHEIEAEKLLFLGCNQLQILRVAYNLCFLP